MCQSAMACKFPIFWHAADNMFDILIWTPETDWTGSNESNLHVCMSLCAVGVDFLDEPCS